MKETKIIDNGFALAGFTSGSEGVWSRNDPSDPPTIDYAALSEKLGENGYDDAVAFLKQYDMKISPTAEKCINGEITIEQLFQNGEVVFE